jgi:hypothetical protein
LIALQANSADKTQVGALYVLQEHMPLRLEQRHALIVMSVRARPNQAPLIVQNVFQELIQTK